MNPVLRPGSAPADLLLAMAERVEASGRPLVYLRPGPHPVPRGALRRLAELGFIFRVGPFWLVKVAGLETAAVLKAGR